MCEGFCGGGYGKGKGGVMGGWARSFSGICGQMLYLCIYHTHQRVLKYLHTCITAHATNPITTLHINTYHPTSKNPHQQHPHPPPPLFQNKITSSPQKPQKAKSNYTTKPPSDKHFNNIKRQYKKPDMEIPNALVHYAAKHCLLQKPR